VNWRRLNKELSLMTEQQVLELLNQERREARRLCVLQRLHQRYSMLRTAREREQILQEAKTL